MVDAAEGYGVHYLAWKFPFAPVPPFDVLQLIRL
jgi:hypothetical protein